jgi:hypothetical protein
VSVLIEVESETEMTRPIQRIAYLAMFALTDAERAEVARYFCNECWRYTGGVVACRCGKGGTK